MMDSYRNRTAGAAACIAFAYTETAGKREAGERPARSRHCKHGALDLVHAKGHAGHWFLETGKVILSVLSCKPGNLPAVGTGAFQTTRTWSCRMNPQSGCLHFSRSYI